MTEDDQILLFTEHNLDTKEDEKTEKAPIKSADSSKFNQLFEKKQDNFKKFDGFTGKKRIFDFSDEDKNQSEKSIIFAPFNSSYSKYDEDHPELFDWPEEVIELLEPKKSKIMRFSKKCRDLNREYEGNNNADLDNGVYNAFVNEQEMEAEQQ